MKRILYIEANRDGTIGGSYYSLLYLVQSLDRSNYEPHVIFCQDNVLIPEFRKATPYVYINNFGPSGSEPASSVGDYLKWPYRLFKQVILKQISLRKIINEIKPDLVHLNNGYSGMHEWMLAGRLNGIKVVAHDRGTKFPCTYRTKIFAKLLDAIICVSDNYKNNVTKQGITVKRLKRVYNGLDINLLEKRESLINASELMSEFNLASGQPLVGILGNITRWKGQHVVVRAIEKVKRQYPAIKCLIVGKVVMRSDAYKKELDEYIRDKNLENNIIFTGFRADVPNILNMLDILIHASIEPEPFGRVILEGMAAGKPIIGTNSGGTPEQIINGETGILVPMDDPDKMAEAIIFYLSDMQNAKLIGERGRQRLAQNFSVRKMTNEIEEIYRDIFAG